MYTVSSQWDKEIRSSGGVRKTVVDLYYPAGSSVPLLSDLPVGKYNVTVDRRAVNRRSGSVTVVSADLLAEMIASPGIDPIEPYGSELLIRSGLVYPDGSEELVPLGYFTVESISWADGDAQINFELFDRSKLLERWKFWIPFPTDGFTALTLIDRLFLSRNDYLDVNFDADVADMVLPTGTFYTGTHLDTMSKLVESLGAEIYFEVGGVARVRNIPFIDQDFLEGEADWVVDAGDQGVLISANRSISRSDTYNVVHVYGTATAGQALPWARAEDLNGLSPTYRYGPFSESDLSVERPELINAVQCKFVADSLLTNSLGLSMSISLSSLSNPALEAGDVILVKFLDGTKELHLVDSLTFDETGSMSIGTRSQQRIE